MHFKNTIKKGLETRYRYCNRAGIWYSILSAVGKIAIVCNAGIIAFSSDFLPMMLYAYEV